MSGFKLQRLGPVMEPEPGNPQEIEGVMNPAQAQRDCFGAHSYERIDVKGTFHTDWMKS
jgi:hypothetical protein